MSARMRAYRFFQSRIVKPWLLPRWMSEERLKEERERGIQSHRIGARRPGVGRIWFHAASVGELESLIPVIQAWVEAGAEAIVTVLSESAGGAVRKLRDLPGAGGVLYAGYSPWEGSWMRVLADARVDAFVTAKYEAWPELWGSLAELKVPLFIVSAKARRSLRIAESLCRVLGGQVPQLTLLTVQDEDTSELLKVFKGVQGVHVTRAGEPRWDRVNFRATQGNARAKALIQKYGEGARPWGLLAQVWPEDMALWQERLGIIPGTLWVVPHRVDPAHVAPIEASLRRAGRRVVRSSGGDAPPGVVEGGSPVDCILVDEMGILLELYSAVDWAYVGGGFGVSMHSTIEPALYGLPVACGPRGEGKFPEIAELRSTGQLTVVRDGSQLSDWFEKVIADLRSGQAQQARERWKRDAAARLGATSRVLEAIRGALSPS